MIREFNEYKSMTSHVCPSCLNKHLMSAHSKLYESTDFKISSLQISIPLKGCINCCKSCIAKISGDVGLYNDYSKMANFDSHYMKSLVKVKEKGCKNIVLTSDKGEPIQNKSFIEKVSNMNKELGNWFNIEIQTTGVLLKDNISFLKDCGVKTISLSVFDIFDQQNNFDIIEMKNKLYFDVDKLCKDIKNSGMVLRLSINLINKYDNVPFEKLFKRINELNPDQVTFKNLWHTEEDNPINMWIRANKASNNIISKISNYLQEKGAEKSTPYKYLYQGRSIWMVDNCMLGSYLILRPNAQLYRSWDALSPESL